jgi:hypothetical protein
MPFGFNDQNNYIYYDMSEIKSFEKPFSENRNIESNIIYESEIILDK